MTNRIIHSHPAPGCTGPVLRNEYSDLEWAAQPDFDAHSRASIDRGFRVLRADRIYVDPVAFYNRHRANEGTAA